MNTGLHSYLCFEICFNIYIITIYISENIVIKCWSAFMVSDIKHL